MSNPIRLSSYIKYPVFSFNPISTMSPACYNNHMASKKKRFVQNNNNYCICYYRYSSHAQNEASIEWQKNLAQDYAEKHGYTIVKEYADKAESGRDENRPQYRLMIAEIPKIKPAVLILYKTDRLARDKYELNVTKKFLKDNGVSLAYTGETHLDENDPMHVLNEGFMEAMAEFYSLNLSQNVTKGLEFNAQNALYNGVKMLGYTVDDTKHYVIDDKTAPIVLRIFNQYADGVGIQEIANSLNAQGLKTGIGKDFNVNGLRHILKNRAYIGEYKYKDIIVPGGIPRLVSDELFEAVQKRFEANKHKSKVQPPDEEYQDVSDPRFWLTGKVFCGKCKAPWHGISGTSKSGRIHYYYACTNYRKHKCKLKAIQKDFLEDCVVRILQDFLCDQEKLAMLAADVSAYARKMYSDDSYLKSLQAEYNKNEKEISNVVNAVKGGHANSILIETLDELEAKRNALSDAIDAEKVKLSLADDDHSIKHYFEMYAEADFSDTETRNMVLDYFVDKIWIFEDKLIVDLFYSDNHTEVNLDAFLAQYEYDKECRKEALEEYFSDVGEVFDQDAVWSIEIQGMRGMSCISILKRRESNGKA